MSVSQAFWAGIKAGAYLTGLAILLIAGWNIWERW